MPDKNNSINRRTVLKTTTTAALFGLAAAGSGGAAGEPSRELVAEYADEQSLQGEFERHADGVVDQLRDAGIVDGSFDFDSVGFEIDEEVTGMEPADADRRAGVTSIREDGTTTALGMVSTSTDTHEIALYVQPERDLAYARVQPHGGGNTLKVTTDDVTPEGCAYTACDSANVCSSDCYEQKKYYSCDSYCENCSVYDTDCSCCACPDCNKCDCCSCE